MLFSSPVYSQASGSIAGITYFQGRSGLATRARRKPTNPNTERQRTTRYIIAVLGAQWGQELTGAERAAWSLYASNIPWTSPLGTTTFLTGQQHFTRANSLRLLAGLDVELNSPPIFDRGTWTPLIFLSATDDGLIKVTFDATDHWFGNATGGIYLWYGRPVGPGIKYYNGPWRFGGRTRGLDPGGSPAGEFSSWPYTVDQQVWCRARIQQRDQRFSSPIILGPISVTAAP